MQKLRERPHGISAVALALGKPVTIEEEITIVSLNYPFSNFLKLFLIYYFMQNDPFKVSTGGMADMKAIKTGKPVNSAMDDAYETGIGTQFSVETNTRDEDAEMYAIYAKTW